MPIIEEYDTDARSIGHGSNYPTIRVGYLEGSRFTEMFLDSVAPFDLVKYIRPAYSVIKTTDTRPWATLKFPVKAPIKYELITKTNTAFKDYVDPYTTIIGILNRTHRIGQFEFCCDLRFKEEMFPYRNSLVYVYTSGSAYDCTPKTGDYHAALFLPDSKLITEKKTNMGLVEFFMTFNDHHVILTNRVNPKCYDNLGIFT